MIYTANIGGYDFPREDIKCFTENVGQRNSIMNAKMYKILPHLFMDTDWSIWVDANTFLEVDPVTLLNRLGNKDVGVFPHPRRDCIYNEAKVCEEKRLDHPEVINEHMKRYKDKGYPKRNGLAYAGIIVRKHTEKIRRLNEKWWIEICKGSIRDQLSFPYIFDREFKYLLNPSGLNSTNTPRQRAKQRAMNYRSNSHKKLTIVCFWWGHWGKEYVERLQRMFSRHTKITHSFVCFTEHVKESVREGDIEYKPIPDYVVRWRGNLTKFFVYKPDNGLSGRVIMVDLDSVLVGDMGTMLSYNGKWCGIKSAKGSKHHIGGGLVSFDHSKCSWLWYAVKNQIEMWTKITQGGERFVYKQLIPSADVWQTLYPGQLVRYKKDIRHKKELPDGACFVAFHGSPRPHQIKDNWIKDNWK